MRKGKHAFDVIVAGGGPAGLAAAMATRMFGKVHNMDIRKLQAGLIRQGAYIDLSGRKRGSEGVSLE